jgi:hypothetical protein
MEPVAKVAFFSFSYSQNASHFLMETRELRVVYHLHSPLSSS